jgi:hypothetical protein
MIGIVVDGGASAGGLHDAVVVPMPVTIESDPRAEPTVERMLAEIRRGNSRIQTAAPSPGAFLEAMRSAVVLRAGSARHDFVSAFQRVQAARVRGWLWARHDGDDGGEDYRCHRLGRGEESSRAARMRRGDRRDGSGGPGSPPGAGVDRGPPSTSLCDIHSSCTHRSGPDARPATAVV